MRKILISLFSLICITTNLHASQLNHAAFAVENDGNWTGFTPWIQPFTPDFGLTPTNGNHSFRISQQAGTANFAANISSYFGHFISEGSYTVEFDVASGIRPLASDFGTLSFDLLGGGNVFTGAHSIQNNTPTGTTWERWSYTFDVISGGINSNLIGSELGMSVTASVDISGQTVAFDNISISTSPVPEPSTYALLALGLLGVGIYSRRTKK